MDLLGIVLAVLVISGLVVKHAAFILMYGSIFDWLRDQGIRRRKRLAKNRMEEGCKSSLSYKFWKKLDQLFSCNLCMTTQCSLWIFAIPITVFVHLRWEHPFERLWGVIIPFVAEALLFVIMILVLAMAIGATGLFFWNLLEHLPSKRDIQRRAIERRDLRLAVMKMKKESKEQGLVVDFTLEDWLALIGRLDIECIAECGQGRRICRENILLEFLNNWLQGKGVNSILAPLLEEVLLVALSGHYYPSKETEYNVHKDRGGIMVLAKQVYKDHVYPELPVL